ncbi:MAG: His-Xaa-Ser system protein HxsD [Elusimicrobia bacterium]|nr:His-Xaa-Ser system protein HxsD [Elusimicrobiota bacterium]
MSKSDGREIVVEVEERLYPAQAVQAAAYAFTDRAYARVEPAPDGRLRAVLVPKTGAAPAAELEGEFRNELLHQALRLKVSEANRKIREFIVTKALVSAQPAAAFPAPEPAAAEDCPECAAQAPAPPLDAELEKEIDRLLAEIDGGEGGDPLGVSVPWEEKFGPADAPPSGEKPS